MSCTMSWNGKKFEINYSTTQTILDLKVLIYEITKVQPSSQKLLGLVKGGKIPRDEAIISELAINSKFMMMGTVEDDKFVMDVPGDDSVVNDLDIDYTTGDSQKPWKDLKNLQALEKVKKTPIHIINDLRPGKKLIVFDLDYTLFDCKSQGIDCFIAVGHISELARPGLHEMLAALYPYYEFCIWSQTSWRWLEAKITELGMLSHHEYKIGFVLDQSAMFSIMNEKRGSKKRHQVKPLQVIWHNLTFFSAKNTIHIDDLSRNFAMNPNQGLKIAPFKNAPGTGPRVILVSRHGDKELLYITKYLLQIARVDDFESISHKDWKNFKGPLPE